MIEAERTSGNYRTEEEAAAAVDQLLRTVSDLFSFDSEVNGVCHSFHSGSRPVRIDRVLFPRRKLIDLGWSSGAIGIEIKKSGHPAGPVVAQAEDYMQSIFTFSSGVSVALNSVFIFPGFSCGGIVQSILAQRRIGFVVERRGRFGLVLNNTFLLDYAIDDEWKVGTAANLRCGAKVGSR